MIDVGISLTSKIPLGSMYAGLRSFERTKFLTIDGKDGYLTNVQVFGESTQAGTPTPDAPVAIVSTTGDVTVRSDSKNLAYSNRVVGTPYSGSGITYVLNADGTITANGTATANTVFQLDSSGARNIRIVAGTTYTVSGLPSAGSSTTFYSEMEVMNDDGTINYYGTFLQAGNAHTPAKSGWARVYVTVRNGTTVSNLIFKPQLEVSPVATTFEKNIASTQTLPLATTQLRSLPNGVSDRIYKSGSSWFREVNVGTVTYNGSESWIIGAVLTGYHRFYVINSSVANQDINTLNAMSPSFPAFTFAARDVTSEGVSAIDFTGTSQRRIDIRVVNTRLSDVSTQSAAVASFKTWLSTNNTTVHYQLATPTTTQITDPTQIAALENIRTYQGITNITASTPVSGSYS